MNHFRSDHNFIKKQQMVKAFDMINQKKFLTISYYFLWQFWWEIWGGLKVRLNKPCNSRIFEWLNVIHFIFQDWLWFLVLFATLWCEITNARWSNLPMRKWSKSYLISLWKTWTTQMVNLFAYFFCTNGKFIINHNISIYCTFELICDTFLLVYWAFSSCTNLGGNVECARMN